MLIDLLVLILIVGLVYWAVTAIPLPPPFRTVAIVLIAIIAIVALLDMMGWTGGMLTHR